MSARQTIFWLHYTNSCAKTLHFFLLLILIIQWQQELKQSQKISLHSNGMKHLPVKPWQSKLKHHLLISSLFLEKCNFLVGCNIVSCLVMFTRCDRSLGNSSPSPFVILIIPSFINSQNISNIIQHLQSMILPGYQTSDSASSDKFQHLALLVVLVSCSSNFYHWPLLPLFVALMLH